MSAPAVPEHYLAGFRSLAERRAAVEPRWLSRLRERAIERFAEHGFPTRRVEDWKYTDVSKLAKVPFAPAPAVDRSATREDALRALGAGFEGTLLVFTNGRFAPGLSRAGALPDGVYAGSLAAALEKEPERLEPHLGRLAAFDDPAAALVALNTAFLEDGALVHVPRGVELQEPIALAFLSTGNGEARVSYPRVLVVAEPGSRVTVVEAYAGAPGRYLTCALTEVAAGAGAAVEHVRLQCEGDGAWHVAALQAHQERDSRFVQHAIALGGALSRSDVNSRIDGQGAQVELRGLYATTAGQHADSHTCIDHAVPHSESRELYKGVLDGRSRAVFNGKVIVRRDAQKTSAQQTNKNLLLSEDAEIDTKPQLEIFADDVKCAHGSTIGHLDELPLFYLRSRGLGVGAARDLLTQAFASEVTGTVRVAPLRDRIEELMLARLAAARERREAA